MIWRWQKSVVRSDWVTYVRSILQPSPTATELERGDAPVFHAQEAAAWAAKRFKEFALKSEDLHQAEPRKRIAATHHSPEPAETKGVCATAGRR